jgi:sugar phosphate isomerase/epimerase
MIPEQQAHSSVLYRSIPGRTLPGNPCHGLEDLQPEHMKSRLRPGLASISFRKLSPEEILAAVSKTELEGIEWGGDVHVPHGDLKIAKRIGLLTREAGLENYCYGSYYRFRDADPNATDKSPSIEAVLDSAEALGAPRVRLWAGEKDFEQASDDYRKALADRAHEVSELAQRRGLAIDLEFHGGTLNNSAENSLELLQMINHPNSHTLWQPAVPLSVDERIAGLEKLLPHVSNVHCFHWGPGGWNERYLLEEGADAWQAYLKALHTQQKPRWFSLEFVQDDSLESLQRDAGCLSRMLTRSEADKGSS